MANGDCIFVYRWLLLSSIAYFLAHWTYLAWEFPKLDWQAVARLALEQLFPSLLSMTVTILLKNMAIKSSSNPYRIDLPLQVQDLR
jgi:hypothetical protein